MAGNIGILKRAVPRNHTRGMHFRRFASLFLAATEPNHTTLDSAKVSFDSGNGIR